MKGLWQKESFKNAVAISTMLISVAGAVCTNAVSFYYNSNRTVLGFISTLLYLFLWSMWMFLLKHKTTFFYFSFFIHSSMILMAIIGEVNYLFGVDFSSFTLFIVPFFVVYDGLLYLPELAGNILKVLIIYQEGVCVFLYLLKKRQHDGLIR